MAVWRLTIITFGLLLFHFNAWADDKTAFWQALKAGGKVVLIRHAEIDRSFGDSFLLDDSCFSEKNLNALGRQQAKNIGQAFREHGIKIHKVYASPHCRTKDTAELAFGDIIIQPVLRLTKALTIDKAEANLAETRTMIGSHQAPGNLILVTHRPNIGELAHIRVDTAEMVVLDPLGDGLYDVIGRLKLQ